MLFLDNLILEFNCGCLIVLKNYLNFYLVPPELSSPSHNNFNTTS